MSAKKESSNWWYAARYEKIVREVGPLLGSSCLEIGPGSGLVARWASQRAKYAAIEHDAAQVHALCKAGLNVAEGSAERLPFPTASFDSFLAFDVLEHVQDDARAISEAFRVLKPGGYAIISVPVCKAIFSSHDISVSHKRRYEREEIIAKLKSAGFTIERGFFWNAILFPAVYARRRFLPDAPQPKGQSDAPEVFSPPPALNMLLLAILRFENFISQWLQMPFGLSYFVIARKPSAVSHRN
jgi:SAM-dependent methyltransferase